VLCPASEEGAGMVPVEALASGRPVVASDIEAHREVCKNAASFATSIEEWCTAVKTAWDASSPPFDPPSWTEAARLLSAVIAECAGSPPAACETPRTAARGAPKPAAREAP
jgi:glycosyltransferase involved in cell wall biosynthesis